MITFLLTSLLFLHFQLKSLLSVTLWSLSYWNFYFLLLLITLLNLYLLITFPSKSLLSDHFSINTYFSSLFYCVLYFLSISNRFPIEISTFWSLFFWNLYRPITFLLKFLLSEHFPIETFLLSDTFRFLHCSIQISTWCHFPITFLLKSLLSVGFWSLSFWNLYFLTTVLLKPLLFDHFPIEISTFWSVWIKISTFSSLSIEISTFCRFLITFLLKSLPFVAVWSLYSLTTFLLKSLLSVQPWPRNYTASSNLQLHSPITRCHHLQPTATLTPQLQGV